MNKAKPIPAANSERNPERLVITYEVLHESQHADHETPHAAIRAGTAHDTEQYEFSVTTDYYDRPDILEAWYRMLDVATGPETLYQSPQFFQYLRDMDQGREASHELFVVRRKIDYAIVGFVPVRTFGRDLDFRFGPALLFKRRLHTCQILGSVPLLAPTEQGLAEFVLQRLFERYAKCDALYMQAMPEEMGATLTRCSGVSAYILHGWRPCHTQPLPESVDAYLRKFSAKKRYNLSRQVRLLTEAAGPLQVMRIEMPEHVPYLLGALDALCPSPATVRDAEQLRLENLARHGLLLSYVIRCGDEDVAVVLGSRSSRVWHVHKIMGQQKYMSLSVGMSAMHLAVMDVLANFTFRLIDYGYGTPNAEFRSTHVLKSRGQVLLHRSRSLMALLLGFHDKYNTVNEALIRQTKAAKKWYVQRMQTIKRTLPKVGKATGAS